MSSGSPIVNLRVPRELLDAIDAHLAAKAGRCSEQPDTRSSFILSAVVEKLHKMARSRGKKRAELPESYERDKHNFAS